MPFETTYRLSGKDADDIKRALLASTAGSACGAAIGCTSPAALAESLIEAFRLVDEATALPDSAKR